MTACFEVMLVNMITFGLPSRLIHLFGQGWGKRAVIFQKLLNYNCQQFQSA